VLRRADDADRQRVVIVATSAVNRRGEVPGAQMRKVVNDVLVRCEDEQLRFPIRVLGELREAAKQVIASTRDGGAPTAKDGQAAARRGRRSHRELAGQAVMPMTSGSTCRRRRK